MNESEKYSAYLCSREWGLLRKSVNERSGGVCERCFWQPAYAVHHKTYKRKYHEHLSDLVHLCEACHDYTHGHGSIDPVQQSNEFDARTWSKIIWSMRGTEAWGKSGWSGAMKKMWHHPTWAAEARKMFPNPSDARKFIFDQADKADPNWRKNSVYK